MNNDDNKLTSQQDPTSNTGSELESPVDHDVKNCAEQEGTFHTEANSKINTETKSNTETETNDSDQSAKHDETQEQSTKSEARQDTIPEPETTKTWHNKNAIKRGIAMLGYGFIAGFVRLGITLIAIFQFFSLLLSEKPNQPLVKFGQNLNTYQYQINQFLTINSEVYPFPFADWPDCSAKESTPR